MMLGSPNSPKFSSSTVLHYTVVGTSQAETMMYVDSLGARQLKAHYIWYNPSIIAGECL